MMIPTKNPAALVGYYLVFLTPFPVLGPVAGLGAIVFGVIGLRRFRQNREVGGAYHSAFAMGAGLVGFVACSVINFMLLFFWLVEPHGGESFAIDRGL